MDDDLKLIVEIAGDYSKLQEALKGAGTDVSRFKERIEASLKALNINKAFGSAEATEKTLKTLSSGLEGVAKIIETNTAKANKLRVELEKLDVKDPKRANKSKELEQTEAQLKTMGSLYKSLGNDQAVFIKRLTEDLAKSPALSQMNRELQLLIHKWKDATKVVEQFHVKKQDKTYSVVNLSRKS